MFYLRLKAAEAEDNDFGREFRELSFTYRRDGYFENPKSKDRFIELANRYDTGIIKHADFIFATCSMSSNDILVKNFSAQPNIAEGASFMRKDQWCNSIVWSNETELSCSAGDHRQLGPLNLNKHEDANVLDESFHKEFV
jgi:hypothetical protein